MVCPKINNLQRFLDDLLHLELKTKELLGWGWERLMAQRSGSAPAIKRMSKPLKTFIHGRYVNSTVSGERVPAFVPAALPPDAGALDLASLQSMMAQANQAVGRLDGMTSAFPDLNLFLYSYVRKEAVLSSQIEGTQSSLTDLLLYENAETPGVPLDDVQEVSNYVAALNHGLKRLRGGLSALVPFDPRDPRSPAGEGARKSCPAR